MRDPGNRINWRHICIIYLFSGFLLSRWDSGWNCPPCLVVLFLYIPGAFRFVLCFSAKCVVLNIKCVYDTVSPQIFHEAVLSLFRASLKERSPLYHRPMYFVIKEHQVPPWTLSLGGQNFSYVTELWKTPHWPLRSNSKLGHFSVAQGCKGISGP